MLELFKYITSDLFVFIGFVIVVQVVLEGISDIVKSIRKK